MEGNVRVATVGGVASMMVMVVVVVMGGGVCATPTTPSQTHTNITDLLHQFTIINKGTYVLYGSGRRSERDLPDCESPKEACNLAHRRFWVTPITERLCRCTDSSEACPLHYTTLNDSLTQHVSNRAQLKFCGNIMEDLGVCKEGDVALTVRQAERKNRPYPSRVAKERVDSHTNLACRCPWPNSWVLKTAKSTSPTETLSKYTCSKLSRCKTGDECGFIRQDTLESYYTCSCPKQHLCVYETPQSPTIITQLHFYGWAYTAKCTSN